MFLGGVGRPKAKLSGDLCPGWREARILDGVFYQVQDLFLAISELEHKRAAPIIALYV